VQFSEHTWTSEFSENSYGGQQQRNHFVTSFSVSYQELFTPLNNTDVCLTVCKEREKHIQRERPHIQRERPHILEFLTAFQKCCVHSPSAYWYLKIQVTQDCLRLCKENRQLNGVDRREGQGITLHDGEGMKSCVTISASLKQLFTSPQLKSCTVYLIIYPTQIF